MKVRLVCDICGETDAPRYYVFDLYTLDPKCTDIEGRPLRKTIVKSTICTKCFLKTGKEFADK